MKNKLKILVFDADQKHSLGIVRTLGKMGNDVYVLSNKKGCLCSWSKYCKKEFVIKKELEYKHKLINLIKDENIDLLMPVGTSSFVFCSENRDEIKSETKVKVMLPPKKSFDIAMSKEKTIKLAEKLGVAGPKTIYPGNGTDIYNEAIKLGDNLVIKAKKEMGINVVEYTNLNDLERKYENLMKEHNFHEDDMPIIQNYINGEGRGYFGFYVNGECIQSYQHERIREFPPSGGMSSCCEISYNREIEESSEKLLKELRWNGVAMVEFKMDQNGKPFLMEINPKFWGSHDLALYSGINFPKMIVNYLTSSKIEKPEEIKKKRYHWPLHGDVQHALINRKNMFNFMKDLCNRDVGSNLKFDDDLKGTLGIFVNLVKKSIRRINA